MPKRTFSSKKKVIEIDKLKGLSTLIPVYYRTPKLNIVEASEQMCRKSFLNQNPKNEWLLTQFEIIKEPRKSDT